MDWQMTALPSPTSFLTSCSASPRGSLICVFTCLSRSSLARLFGEVMITSRKGLPMVVGPMFTTLSLPPPSFSSSLKYSTILSQRAILRSLPSWKPKNFSGDVIELCAWALLSRGTKPSSASVSSPATV